MYYQNYEDYMRQVLGYPACDPRIYESYNYIDSQDYEDTYYFRNQETSNLSDEEIRGLYPDIYNLAYPMVCKVCEINTQPITRDLIEKMTDEVYNAIEASNTVVNVRVDAPINQSKRENIAKTSRMEDSRMQKNNLERKQETRQYNSNLRDLIKILLLFRLFGNRPGRPRPPLRPFPGGPGRPPFPGGPGPGRPPMGPGGRPPIIQPRDYID